MLKVVISNVFLSLYDLLFLMRSFFLESSGIIYSYPFANVKYIIFLRYICMLSVLIFIAFQSLCTVTIFSNQSFQSVAS